LGRSYSVKGNQLINEGKFEEALTYYNMAASLKPDDEEVKGKIASLRKKDLKLAEDVEVKTETTENSQTEEKTQKQNDTNKISESINYNNNLSDWDTDEFIADDFGQEGNKLYFSDTDKIKKLIYKHQMEDFDIEVRLIIYTNISTKRVGIIFGYEKSETDKSENYYLYAVNNHGYSFAA
jgi:hypothetical protein